MEVLIGAIISVAAAIGYGIASGVQGRRLGRESAKLGQQEREDDLAELNARIRLSEEGLDLKRSELTQKEEQYSFQRGEASADRLQKHAEYINSILDKESAMKNNLINILSRKQGANYAI